MNYKLDWFKQNRQEQTKTARDICIAIKIDNKRLIGVNAPVKSGKREIVEICSLLTNENEFIRKRTKHFFVTSLNRKDILTQEKELKSYGIDVHCITKGKTKSGESSVTYLKNELTKCIKKGIQPWVHFDESDYGTGVQQKFESLYNFLLEKKIPVICYSATNEELFYSEDFKKSFALQIIFDPAPTYRGAAWFLDNHLISDAEPFYLKGSFTNHAIDILDTFCQSDKPVGVLRLPTDRGEPKRNLASYKHFVGNQQVKKDLAKRGIKTIFVDENQPFIWDDPERIEIDVIIPWQCNKLRTLFVICQTATRSTEMKIHPVWDFYHEYYFPDTETYNTLAQRYLRVAHYDVNGWPIRVYGIKKIFEYAVGRSSSQNKPKIISRRISPNGEKLDPNDKFVRFEPVVNHDYKSIGDAQEKLITRAFNEGWERPRKSTASIKQKHGEFHSLWRDPKNPLKDTYRKVYKDEVERDPLYKYGKGSGKNRWMAVYDRQTNQLLVCLRIHSGKTIMSGQATKNNSIYSVESHLVLH